MVETFIIKYLRPKNEKILRHTQKQAGMRGVFRNQWKI